MLIRSFVECVFVFVGLTDLLIREETASVSCSLRLLYRMYAETVKDSQSRNAFAEDRLVRYVLVCNFFVYILLFVCLFVVCFFACLHWLIAFCLIHHPT